MIHYWIYFRDYPQSFDKDIMYNQKGLISPLKVIMLKPNFEQFIGFFELHFSVDCFVMM